MAALATSVILQYYYAVLVVESLQTAYFFSVHAFDPGVSLYLHHRQLYIARSDISMTQNSI